MEILKFAAPFALLFCLSSATAQTQARPLYQLSPMPLKEETTDTATQNIIAGNDAGLFRITDNNTALPLWTEGRVKQILRTETVGKTGNTEEHWYFITSKGILYSQNLNEFEFRNTGLPSLVIHEYDKQKDSYTQQIEDLKDICANPLNPMQLVTATKDNVYISFDGALNWKSLGSMSKTTAGIKAVAIADMPHFAPDGNFYGMDPVVFMSHPIFGLSYVMLNDQKPAWTDVTSGFKMMSSLTAPDEISDILPVLKADAEGRNYVDIYISQTFIPNIYRFNWEKKKGELLYGGNEPSDTIESLVNVEDTLLFTRPSDVGTFDLKEQKEGGIPGKFSLWKERFDSLSLPVQTAWIPKAAAGFEKGFVLNELWMLYPEKIGSKYANVIKDNKRSLYIPPYQVRKQLGSEGIDKFLSIVEENGLNSVVIDMKDDYGLLRYSTKDSLVAQKATESQYSVDIDQFISKFKEKDIYLIARIVVFKDKNLARYGGGKYAVWDAVTGRAWVGIKGYEDVKNEEGTIIGKETVYYDENWVDPYSAEVWEYNVGIAKELIARGFDEIQFDYIRFPTDGYNLKNARFRWHSQGMTKESALMSFLAYARKQIEAPLGIDIYGANGWYRSGARTGQDVEMLSNYVDVICPMFYPSHFEQDFLLYEPVAERPYRIYFYGAYRNSIIGRNRIIVRPWVQAFYLNVRYDRQFYSKEYVRQQLFGIRDSVNKGYMYWNNVGNYSMIQPDIGEEPYSGKTKEAGREYRKPAFGISENAKNKSDSEGQRTLPSISVIDSVRKYESPEKNRFLNIFKLPSTSIF